MRQTCPTVNPTDGGHAPSASFKLPSIASTVPRVSCWPGFSTSMASQPSIAVSSSAAHVSLRMRDTTGLSTSKIPVNPSSPCPDNAAFKAASNNFVSFSVGSKSASMSREAGLGAGACPSNENGTSTKGSRPDGTYRPSTNCPPRPSVSMPITSKDDRPSPRIATALPAQPDADWIRALPG